MENPYLYLKENIPFYKSVPELSEEEGQEEEKDEKEEEDEEEETEKEEEEEEEKEEEEEEKKGTELIDTSHCSRVESSSGRSPNETKCSSVKIQSPPKSSLLKFVTKEMDRLISCCINFLDFSHKLS